MRLEQVNSLLQTELANLINRDLPAENFLVTITYVETDPSLKSARIGISVLPEKFAGTALEMLSSHSSMFSKSLLKKTRLRQIPRFHWRLDTTEQKASEIEELINLIKERDEKESKN